VIARDRGDGAVAWRPGARLRRGDFDRRMATYRPSSFEAFAADDPRFRRPAHHALKSRDRLFAALASGLGRLARVDPAIVDLGPYPGSLLRLLRELCPRARLVGAGLMATPAFVGFMREDCGAEIVTVNLDPASPDLGAKAYPERVPLADDSVDLVFALEIVEHLRAPFHLAGEAFRILVPGGHLVLTTPNVTRIGNVFKLLVGRSPNDRLAPPGYHDPDDEWRPHAREYAMGEMVEVLAGAGFAPAEARFFVDRDTDPCVRSSRQRLIDLAKVPFHALPHLRDSLLLVGRKPER
jgi:SAM-dependent methyltransferase